MRACVYLYFPARINVYSYCCRCIRLLHNFATTVKVPPAYIRIYISYVLTVTCEAPLVLCILYFYFTVPSIIFVLLLSSTPSLFVTEIQGHRVGTSPAFSFIARRIQHFLPSSTRVELYIHTLLVGAFWMRNFA